MCFSRGEPVCAIGLVERRRAAPGAGTDQPPAPTTEGLGIGYDLDDVAAGREGLHHELATVGFYLGDDGGSDPAPVWT